MPAGSPEVIASAARLIGAIACDSVPTGSCRRVAEEFDLDAGRHAIARRHRRDPSPARSRRAACVGLAEHPQQLERLRGVDLAGVLDRAAERQRVAFAAEHRKLVELRAVAQHLPAGEALARIEVVPAARRQRDLDLAALADDRRDQQRVAAHELRFEIAHERIAGKRERHRAHHRQAVARRLRDHGFEIGNQPIAEGEPFAADRLGFGSEHPRLALADAVHAHVRAEHASPAASARRARPRAAPRRRSRRCRSCDTACRSCPTTARRESTRRVLPSRFADRRPSRSG